MTEYRIIETRFYQCIWDDDYLEYLIYSGFKKLGKQENLFEKAETNWKFLFSFINRDSTEEMIRNMSEELVNWGFSAKDKISEECRRRYIHQELETIKPSEGEIRGGGYLEKRIREIALKDK